VRFRLGVRLARLETLGKRHQGFRAWRTETR
jgi:hypothetical protein